MKVPEPLVHIQTDNFFYFTSPNIFKLYNSTTGVLEQTTDYRARVGRDDITFLLHTWCR